MCMYTIAKIQFYNLDLSQGIVRDSLEYPFSHMIFYFYYFSLTLEEIEKRVTHLDILRTLKSKPEDFYSRMSTYVFPGLAGTDHEMLLYYYSLLEGCPVPQGEAEPQQHVKLLRKISGIASGGFIICTVSISILYLVSCFNKHFLYVLNFFDF